MLSVATSFPSRKTTLLTNKTIQPTQDQSYFKHITATSNTTIYSLNQTMASLTNATISENPWNTTLLSALNAEMFSRLAPAVAILVAVMVVGTVGNIIVCYIFSRKLRPSSQNCLLLSLGTFDLASCCVGVPSVIFDIRDYYMYQSEVGCKIMRFFTTLPNLASILVLLVIAADRYRKICKPLHHQIHRCHVKISLAIIVVIASLLSLPALFIYGYRILPTPIPGEFGYECSISETQLREQYHVMYEGLFCALFIICTTALVLIYVKIWRETKRHIKYMKTHAMFGSVLLNEKYNMLSGNSDENMSDSRRNSEATSMNSVGVQRCCMCVRKTGKKRMSCPDVDALKPVVIPIISLTSREMERTDNAVPEYYYGALNMAADNGGDATTNQMFELPVISKQADFSENISLACLPNCGVIKSGVPEETVEAEAGEDVYDTTDDQDLVSADTKQCNKTPESGLFFLQENDDYQNVGDLNLMIPSSKQCETTLESCLHPLEPDREIQDVSDQNLLLSDTKQCNKTHESVLKSNFNNQDEEDQNSMLSDAKYSTTSQSCLYSMETNHESPDLADRNLLHLSSRQDDKSPEHNCYLETNHDIHFVDVAAGISFNDKPCVCAQSTSALIGNINRPRNSKFSHKFSKLTSLRMNSNRNHKHNPPDIRRLSEPIKQISKCNCRSTKSCRKYNDNQSQQTEETTFTEYSCQTHPCDSLPENTQCLKHFLNTKISKVSRQSSCSSQSTICSDNESVELDYFQSKRVSFSRDLDDCEYSTPVTDALELPESTCLNKLHRSRSDQSLLSARRSKKALRSTRTTILAFAITLGFIISYLPYLILVLLRSVIANFGQELDDVSLNVYNIFLRSFFANNVINIFVYSYMHLEFRMQLSQLWNRWTLSTPKDRNCQTSKTG